MKTSCGSNILIVGRVSFGLAINAVQGFSSGQYLSRTGMQNGVSYFGKDS